MTKEISITSNVNFEVLDNEMRAAAVSHYAGLVGRKGNVWLVFTDAADQNDIDAALVVVGNHDPTVTSPSEIIRQREEQAQVNAANIPGWASWDETEVQDWIDGKFDDASIAAISNVADAQVVLGHMSTAIQEMARMMLALRDDTWPNLGN